MRGQRGDVRVELEHDAAAAGGVDVPGGRELDGAGGARRVEAQRALVRVQRVRVEPGTRRMRRSLRNRQG